MASPPPRTPEHRSPRAPAPADGAAGAGADGLAAARQRAVRILTDRYGDGTVGDDEFEARLARLREASDTVTMDAVVADLPDTPQERLTPTYDIGPRVPHQPSRPAGPAASAPPPPPVQDSLPPGERRLVSLFSEMKRNGWWEVPPFLRVLAVAADVKLDLRDTVIPEGCTFDVGCYMAAVTIIVRPGTSVHLDVLPMLGTAVNKAPAEGPFPHLRVTGNAVMGEVKVIVREPGERGRRSTSWWGSSG